MSTFIGVVGGILLLYFVGLGIYTEWNHPEVAKEMRTNAVDLAKSLKSSTTK